MKKIILAILATLAFMFVLGSAGAYEYGNIGFWQMLVQVGIGATVEWVTLACLNRK